MQWYEAWYQIQTTAHGLGSRRRFARLERTPTLRGDWRPRGSNFSRGGTGRV
jgi:hypothetical protein